MIIEINKKTLSKIKNPVFAGYAAMYGKINEDFMVQVRKTGIEVDNDGHEQLRSELLESLRQKGANFRNGGRSIFINRISGACEACETGVGSATFFISLKCHRSCFYCFNPNQENYEKFQHSQRDVTGELQEIHASGQKISHLALSGGEPLLHKDETVGFFDYATKHFPKNHKRLYTSGDHIDRELLEELRAAGLDEIRFSIRMHDLEKGQMATFDRLALAREYIPTVMVEMPVLPDTQEMMQSVLLELDRLDIHSVNLLEFCYPFNNAEVFRKGGYRLKKRPYRILYNYWYAGGLPVAESELECLALISFALDKGLKIGIHYCSLENKLTGQLYQQNSQHSIPATAHFSQKDYLLKSAKAFGEDIHKVKRVFRQQGYSNYTVNDDLNFIEFAVSQIPMLQNLSLEIGISSAVVEMRAGEQCVRELALELTTPQKFDLSTDI